MDKILNDWPKGRTLIKDLEEGDLRSLITAEKKGLARETVLTAVHQRLCKLRTTREREALREFAQKKKEKLAAKANGARAKR